MDDADHPEQDEDDQPVPRTALVALLVVVLLIAGGLWLTHVLHNASAIQDCASSGRTNCAPVQN